MNPARWARALQRIPLVVSFTPFLDETAQVAADIILPDHGYLERWEDAALATGFAVCGVRTPVVAPLHQTRATGDVVIELARRLGDAPADAFPWKNFKRAMSERSTGLYQSGRGNLSLKSEKRFLKELIKQGFWTDASYPFESWSEVLRTPSGRFEFFSQTLWRDLQKRAAQAGVSSQELLSRWGLAVTPERLCMHGHRHLARRGHSERFPFLLVPYKRGGYAEGSGANLPLLRELVTEPGQRPWRTMVELAPEAAVELGIRENDLVEVTSATASLRVRAHLRVGLRADMVRIAQGGGHTAMGGFARGKGVNVLELLDAALDPMTGIPAIQGVAVALRRLS